MAEVLQVGDEALGVEGDAETDALRERVSCRSGRGDRPLDGLVNGHGRQSSSLRTGWDGTKTIWASGAAGRRCGAGRAPPGSRPGPPARAGRGRRPGAPGRRTTA